MGTVHCRLDCGGVGLIRSPATPGKEKCPELRCPYNSYRIVGKKVLSVTMPWAWLIMKYGKDVENRSWKTNYRGRILIHASKKPDPKIGEILFHWCSLVQDDCYRAAYYSSGCIIGSVELVDCVQGHSSKWAEAKARNSFVPFKPDEVFQFLRLGNMRYWSLFGKQFKKAHNYNAE